MINLRNWTAKRSGASITIKGTAASGETIVISSVIEIRAGAPWPIAVTRDGGTFQLGSTAVPANAPAAAA